MAVAESSGLLPKPSRLRAWFHNLSLATVLAAFALVVLGGVVRVTESGLGCPDWPLCHGGVLPPWEPKAIIEYSHRLVASALVGPLVLATCGVAWVAYRREKWVVISASVALVLVLAQALLGGVAVLKELPGMIVAAHLALGEALLGSLILVLVVAHRGPLAWRLGNLGISGKQRFPLLVTISGIGVYVLIMTGSYVTVAGATGACADWPMCQGRLVPETQLQTIHMAHRFATALVGIILFYTLHLGFREGQNPREIRFLSMTAAALFLAQVIVGAATVWLRFPVELKALHLAMATLVWGNMVALVTLSFVRGSPPTPEAAYA